MPLCVCHFCHFFQIQLYKIPVTIHILDLGSTFISYLWHYHWMTEIETFSWKPVNTAVLILAIQLQY